jgi:hypothetical protein
LDLPLLSPAIVRDSELAGLRLNLVERHHSRIHVIVNVVYATDPQDARQTDPNLGGFIEEFHTCPKCGGGASRHD